MNDFLRKSLFSSVAIFLISIGIVAFFTQKVNAAGPPVSLGQTFADPTFGATLRRLSNVFPGTGSSLIYGINGLWNSDETLYASNVDSGGTVNIINTTTGVTIASHVPFSPAGSSEFDPVNPNIFYYWSGPNLFQYSISAQSSRLVKTFAADLRTLGGSSDFIDRTGRYFLLNIGGEMKIWDKTNDMLFAGSIPASVYDASGGFAGISPDGKYVVVDSDFNHISYIVDQQNKTLSSVGALFWTLCGDHGDTISASNGKTYQITADCYDSPDIYLVDVSRSQFPLGTFFHIVPKLSQSQIDIQKAGSIKLFGISWKDATHFSCAETSDWCYVSVESTDDTFGSLAPPRQFKSEIVRVLAVPPYTVEHLAHHGSLGASYTASPRINASPSGSRAMFASDFGYNNGQQFGYSDIYSIETFSDTERLQMQIIMLLKILIGLLQQKLRY